MCGQGKELHGQFLDVWQRKRTLVLWHVPPGERCGVEADLTRPSGVKFITDNKEPRERVGKTFDRLVSQTSWLIFTEWVENKQLDVSAESRNIFDQLALDLRRRL